jgi:hypothetical protein
MLTCSHPPPHPPSPPFHRTSPPTPPQPPIPHQYGIDGGRGRHRDSCPPPKRRQDDDDCRDVEGVVLPSTTRNASAATKMIPERSVDGCSRPSRTRDDRTVPVERRAVVVIVDVPNDALLPRPPMRSERRVAFVPPVVVAVVESRTCRAYRRRREAGSCSYPRRRGAGRGGG